MNPQKRDLIIGQKQVWEEAQMVCNLCGEDAAPFSCFCHDCEEQIYLEEGE